MIAFFGDVSQRHQGPEAPQLCVDHLGLAESFPAFRPWRVEVSHPPLSDVCDGVLADGLSDTEAVGRSEGSLVSVVVVWV